MDFSAITNWFTLENIMALIEEYRSWGPLPGLGLPILEAFLPFLPLVVIIMANASAFGLGYGFLLSWLGTSTGSLLVFLIVRQLAQKRMATYIKKRKQVSKMLNFVEKRGFGLLFLVYCIPFTPSSVINIVAGLSNISVWQYALAAYMAKMVAVFVISFIGYDIPSLVQNPGRTIFAIVLIVVLWFVGKRIEIWLNQKVEEEERIEREKSEAEEPKLLKVEER